MLSFILISNPTLFMSHACLCLSVCLSFRLFSVCVKCVVKVISEVCLCMHSSLINGWLQSVPKWAIEQWDREVTFACSFTYTTSLQQTCIVCSELINSLYKGWEEFYSLNSPVLVKQTIWNSLETTLSKYYLNSYGYLEFPTIDPENVNFMYCWKRMSAPLFTDYRIRPVIWKWESLITQTTKTVTESW